MRRRPRAPAGHLRRARKHSYRRCCSPGQPRGSETRGSRSAYRLKNHGSGARSLIWKSCNTRGSSTGTPHCRPGSYDVSRCSVCVADSTHQLSPTPGCKSARAARRRWLTPADHPICDYHRVRRGRRAWVPPPTWRGDCRDAESPAGCRSACARYSNRRSRRRRQPPRIKKMAIKGGWAGIGYVAGCESFPCGDWRRPGCRPGDRRAAAGRW